MSEAVSIRKGLSLLPDPATTDVRRMAMAIAIIALLCRSGREISDPTTTVPAIIIQETIDQTIAVRMAIVPVNPVMLTDGAMVELIVLTMALSVRLRLDTA